MSFEKMYKANYKIVYGYLINLSKNESVAEELTAQTFLKALENYKLYKDEEKPSAWLCRIARNEYFKFYNKHKRIDSEAKLENIYTDNDIEEIIIDKDLALLIHKHLHTLNEPYKEVFVLKTFAELSFKEISQIFNRNETWARVTYYRAKIKLKERMNGNDK